MLNSIVNSIEVFLKYGPWGIVALMLLLNYMERRQNLKVVIDNVIILNELKVLLQGLVWRLNGDKKE